MALAGRRVEDEVRWRGAAQFSRGLASCVGATTGAGVRIDNDLRWLAAWAVAGASVVVSDARGLTVEDLGWALTFASLGIHCEADREIRTVLAETTALTRPVVNYHLLVGAIGTAAAASVGKDFLGRQASGLQLFQITFAFTALGIQGVVWWRAGTHLIGGVESQLPAATLASVLVDHCVRVATWRAFTATGAGVGHFVGRAAESVKRAFTLTGPGVELEVGWESITSVGGTGAATLASIGVGQDLVARTSWALARASGRIDLLGERAA